MGPLLAILARVGAAHTQGYLNAYLSAAPRVCSPDGTPLAPPTAALPGAPPLATAASSPRTPTPQQRWPAIFGLHGHGPTGSNQLANGAGNSAAAADRRHGVQRMLALVTFALEGGRPQLLQAGKSRTRTLQLPDGTISFWTMTGEGRELLAELLDLDPDCLTVDQLLRHGVATRTSPSGAPSISFMVPFWMPVGDGQSGLALLEAAVAELFPQGFGAAAAQAAGGGGGGGVAGAAAAAAVEAAQAGAAPAGGAAIPAVSAAQRGAAAGGGGGIPVVAAVRPRLDAPAARSGSDATPVSALLDSWLGALQLPEGGGASPDLAAAAVASRLLQRPAAAAAVVREWAPVHQAAGRAAGQQPHVQPPDWLALAFPPWIVRSPMSWRRGYNMPALRQVAKQLLASLDGWLREWRKGGGGAAGGGAAAAGGGAEGGPQAAASSSSSASDPGVAKQLDDLLTRWSQEEDLEAGGLGVWLLVHEDVVRALWAGYLVLQLGPRRLSGHQRVLTDGQVAKLTAMYAALPAAVMTASDRKRSARERAAANAVAMGLRPPAGQPPPPPQQPPQQQVEYAAGAAAMRLCLLGREGVALARMEASSEPGDVRKAAVVRAALAALPAAHTLQFVRAAARAGVGAPRCAAQMWEVASDATLWLKAREQEWLGRAAAAAAAAAAAQQQQQQQEGAAAAAAARGKKKGASELLPARIRLWSFHTGAFAGRLVGEGGDQLVPGAAPSCHLPGAHAARTLRVDAPRVVSSHA